MPRKIVKTLDQRSAKNVGAKALKDKRTRRVFTEEFRREAVAGFRLSRAESWSISDRLPLPFRSPVGAIGRQSGSGNIFTPAMR